MNPLYQVPVWKQAPTLRLLFPLTAGIILQWYVSFSLLYIAVCMVCAASALLLFVFFPTARLAGLAIYRGVIFHLLLLSFGMLLTWQKDARHHSDWYGHFLTDSSTLLVKINEPPVIKARSIKAEAVVTAVINGNTIAHTSGNLLIYFSKDSLPFAIDYGQYILIGNKLQSITNSGNPGAFNYKRYAAFQLLYDQAFLKREDWTVYNYSSVNYFRHFLFRTRDYILSVLKTHIGNRQNELGIAEALLIGYKEDLDKDLVQAYSNTGVVHIIAISGLHLGLIYIVLAWLFDHLPYIKRSKHIKACSLVACLWLFALLTGGSASVLRSAVMFTVIILGKYYFRQSGIYNSLSVSVFLLLCYNPYYLWDVGFQLSYAAVTGIVAFQQFIYRQWFPSNRLVRQLWSMVTVTLAAQLGTFPVCIYYFHQFPNLFLFSNLIAVPLSTIILFAEIFLIITASFQWLANYTGIAFTWLIRALNNIILFFDSFSFSVYDKIYANILTTWVLYGIVFFFIAGLMHKKKKLLLAALVCVAAFCGLHAYAQLKVQQQKKIIIYNISRCRAIDFIYKHWFVFTGDSILRQEGLQQNFHLKPARISLQAVKEKDSLPVLQHRGNYWQFLQTKILVLDNATLVPSTLLPADIVLFSRNPPVDISRLIFTAKPDCIVFDASNSLWKIQKWKSQCEQLLLRCHSVPEQGAFVLDIE
ncbi:MAG: ComEC/Rec2 family competence protein [Ferruginibacter sp.]